MSYSELATEAALCLWEAVVEDWAKASTETPWADWREEHGTSALRQAVMSWGQACSDDWHALQPSGGAIKVAPLHLCVFDWEFCPVWLRVAVNWAEVEAGHYPTLLTEEKRRAAVLAYVPADAPKSVETVEAELCEELRAYCEAQGLPYESADELLVCELTHAQRLWISDFYNRWELFEASRADQP